MSEDTANLPAGTPPTLTVKVTLGFVPGCPDWLAVLERVSSAAFRDPQVTGFTALPGRKHAHDAAEGVTALPGLTSVATPVRIAAPHPAGTHAELFDPATLAKPAETPNGFDA